VPPTTGNNYLINQLFFGGCSSPRNFPANTFHFGQAVTLSTLLGYPRKCCYLLGIWADDAIYGSYQVMPFGMEKCLHAPKLQLIGADAALPMAELQLLEMQLQLRYRTPLLKSPQSQLLKRPIALQGIDLELARAIASLRLHTRPAALEELRKAAAVTVSAHLSGMASTHTASFEAVRAAMERVIIHNMTLLLQQYRYRLGRPAQPPVPPPLQPGDLLLADAVRKRWLQLM